MSNASLPTPSIELQPWYRTITRDQWKALLAAKLGWMLDAMDVVLYLMVVNTLRREFGMNDTMAGLVTTVSLLMAALGGILFGLVADKIGRTRALMATILVFSFCSLGSATSQDVYQLLFWRALLGLGMGGEWAAGAVLVSETWPPQHRAKAIGIMQSGWALGYILGVVVSALVLEVFELSWRWLFAVGALPALLTLWVRHEVKEPAIWSAHQGASFSTTQALGELFGARLRYRTIMASLLTAVVLFGYWGVFTWMPTFFARPIDQGGAGMSILKSVRWLVYMQIGAFFGYLSFGFLAERYGRRLVFSAFLVAAAIIVPVYGSMAHAETLLLYLAPVLGYVGHGYFSIFGALLAELFPTRVRGTGQGLTYNAGRALAALAPFTVGAVADTWNSIGAALMLTSVFFLLGAVLIYTLPDTTGAQLEE